MDHPNPFSTPERTAFEVSFRRFVETEVTPFVDDWDEAGEVPWALHEKIGAFGVWGLGVDSAHGGLGMDDAFVRARFGEILFGCGASGVAAAVGARMISIAPLARFAPESFKTDVLPEIIAGRVNSALAITEPSGGSDVASLSTKARRVQGGWVLNGEKTYPELFISLIRFHPDVKDWPC